jgi:hypothetical protein
MGVDKNSTNEGSSIKYQVYIDERKSLVNASLEQSHLFDKAILTLASGAFGLSLTFIRQIVPEGCEPKNISFLILAWIFLALSIISTVLSFLTSSKACTKQIEIMEIEYKITEETTNSDKKHLNCYRRITNRLNIFSVLCFMVGIFFLAKFSIHNL